MIYYFVCNYVFIATFYLLSCVCSILGLVPEQTYEGQETTYGYGMAPRDR